MTDHFKEALALFIEGLNKAERAQHEARGYTFGADAWYVYKNGRRFAQVNCGGSGAFMIENETGEIYNIKGLGQPDYNKKAKANLGRIQSADPTFVHARRWNYLDNQGRPRG